MGSLDVRPDRVDPLIGSMLGKDYRVIEQIGFGGMAVVYLVEHQTLRKRFAAKVLSVELAANLEARARFTQEAHAASQLDHENIVGISDFGVTIDARPFFVMELLRGQTLDQRVAEAPMSIEEVVAVAVPVARALAHAHAEDIIHRDVKPENVFLVKRSQGRFGVKVVDFGIAKTPVNTKLTKMGETLGSPMFMSPEACRGEDVDHRADLYSFGVLLYLMLCRRVPFQDENLLKVLQMQVTEPLPPPRSINPDISPELAAVIERALAKDPDARYASMDALLRDLEAAVPPGSDRLLIEAQAGGASSFRLGTFSGQSRQGDSQQMSRVASQPLPSHVSRPVPAIAGSDTMPAVASHRRKRAGWIVALPIVGIAVIGAWLVVGPGSTSSPSADPGSPAAVHEPAPPPAHDPPAQDPPAHDPPAHDPPAAAPAPAAAAPAPAAAAPAMPSAPVEPPRAVPPQVARPPRAIKRPAPPPPPSRRDIARPASAAGSAAGSAAPKGDPSLDIRLSR
jgi:serine/threonine protein kinase